MFSITSFEVKIHVSIQLGDEKLKSTNPETIKQKIKYIS